MSINQLRATVIQMPVQTNPWLNAQYLERRLATAVSGEDPCHLAVGVKLGICPGPPLPERNEMYGYLGDIAARYQVYLLPGSMKVTSGPQGGFLDQFPVFGPNGALLGRCNNPRPWGNSPEEADMGRREHLIFDIPEKGSRVGVLSCLDADFRETARTLARSGAEVIIQLSMDPEHLMEEYSAIRQSSAVENRVYSICTNGVGQWGSLTLAGGSRIFDPGGEMLYCAGPEATTKTVSLDLDRLRSRRLKDSNADKEVPKESSSTRK